MAVVVALVVVGAAGVCAVPAYAFVSRSTKAIVVPRKSTTVVATKCPAGEHVSFGGVMSQFSGPITATNQNAHLVLTTSMHRLGANPAELTVSALNPRILGAHLTVVAYCDRGAVPTMVSKTVSLGAGQLGAAVATCPAGTVGVGGGFASPTGSAQDLKYLGELVMASDTQLSVGMSNLSKVPTTITALVYCAPGTAPLEHDTTLNVGGHKLVSAEVTCPGGTKLVWGGLDTSVPTGTATAFSAVTPLSWYAPTATQWKVTAYNVGTKAGTLTAAAYCR